MIHPDTYYFQWLVMDPNAPQGIASSDSMAIVVPPVVP